MPWFTPQRITFIVIGVLIVSGIVMMALFLSGTSDLSRLQQIARTGVSGTARILSVSETNSRVKSQIVARVALEVTRPGAAPYRAETKVILTAINGGLYQVGNRVSVRVDPKHPERVAIVGPGA